MPHDNDNIDVRNDANRNIPARGLAELDFPFGSLDAAALFDLPYSFEPRGPRTAFYRDCFA